jgi:hypothetical protein
VASTALYFEKEQCENYYHHYSAFFTEIVHNVLGLRYFTYAMFYIRTPGKTFFMSTFLLTLIFYLRSVIMKRNESQTHLGAHFGVHTVLDMDLWRV